jgi:beta-lactamase superfamily II metal-dependent hydrolase
MLMFGWLIPNIMLAQDVLIHSHNDYRQSKPFYHAYSQEVASIEADIFVTEKAGELLVAHDRFELPVAPTLDESYIMPIVRLFQQNRGRIWENSKKTLILLIDLKTPVHPTLDVLIDKLKQFPEVFNPAVNPYAVRVVITGNRPNPENFGQYPSFISFDGNRTSYSAQQLEKITMVSFNFRDYSRWNGDGALPKEEREKLMKVIDEVHALGKPVRFWGTPDNANSWRTLHSLCVDFINTDRPEECKAFFRNLVTDFILWQLPSQINTIGNSYIILTYNGKVVVMDGGFKEETPYLRGFLAALGNEVEAWFVSHPHGDHVGALTEILKSPQGIVVKKIYHSEYSQTFIDLEPQNAEAPRAFYEALAASGVSATNYSTPGAQFGIDGVNFKILAVTNENIRVNPYNNSNLVVRVWDEKKSILFLGDLGLEGGDLLLNGAYRKDLDCDYMQMAHHGQNGVSKDFYRTVKFSACLWPTPSWVYNNDAGKGFNTHVFETVEIRELMKEIGITEHYVSCEGLHKIE